MFFKIYFDIHFNFSFNFSNTKSVHFNLGLPRVLLSHITWGGYKIGLCLSVCQCICLSVCEHTHGLHFLIDFHQNWHRRKNPQIEERVL